MLHRESYLGFDELTKGIVSELELNQLRFEVYDTASQITFLEFTSIEAIETAQSTGSTSFQIISADGREFPVKFNLVDGEWQCDDGTKLAAIQFPIDAVSLSNILIRSHQRALIKHYNDESFDVETDRQMAMADVYGLCRIQDPTLYNYAALAISDNASKYLHYKTALEEHGLSAFYKMYEKPFAET